eukprot:1019840-Karenia_brevis.AAC.1
MTSNVISSSPAISACEKGGQCKHVTAQLDTMCMSGETTDVVSLSSAISACENDGQWEDVAS